MWNNNQYILKEGWGKSLINDQVHQNFLANHQRLKIIEEFDHVAGHHPVVDHLINQKENIISLAKKLLVDVYDFEHSIQVYDNNQGLPLHNDFYDDNRDRAVSGIIWLNPIAVEGTLVYNKQEKLIGQLGGNPGDLLLFLTTEQSHHSALNTTDIPRYTINLTFANKI